MEDYIKEAQEKLRVMAKCTDKDCDNEGTTYYTGSDGSPEPHPCRWCHERDAIIPNILTEASKDWEQERMYIKDWVVKNYSRDAKPLYAHVDVADLLRVLRA